MRDADTSSIERGRRLVVRVGVVIIAAVFLTGLILWLAGQDRASGPLFASALILLIAMPIVNVVSALAEEVRRRDWPFALAATVVLLMIAYSIVNALA